jgi:uncharacterized tellurite resistance protein B-like protein
VSVSQLLSWLGVGEARDDKETTPLRELVETLDRLDPARARYLARFAYLLGRVAHADRQVSPEETRAMEALVVREGGLTADQATVVVGLAKTSNLLFGGTADYQVALEFAEAATYAEKLSLGRCLFAVASSDQQISMPEEAEIHRILNQLRILPEDLTQLRVEHGRYLPGRARSD